MKKKLGLIASLLLCGALLSGTAGCMPRAAAKENSEEPDVTAVSLTQVSAPIPAAPLFTRFQPYSGADELLPRQDYGPLLPYVGAEKPIEGYILDTVPLWGLVTEDGQIVTDPVYSSIEPYGPYLLLYRGVAPEVAHYQAFNREDGSAEATETRATVIARDGRWILDTSDWNHSLLLDDGRLAIAREDGSVDLLTPEGTVDVHFPRSSLMPYLGVDYTWGTAASGYNDGGELIYAGGPLAVCVYDEDAQWGNGWRYDCFLDPHTGKVTGEPPEDWDPSAGWGEWDETPEFDGYTYPDRIEDIITGKVYYCAGRTDAPDASEDLLDADGFVLRRNVFTASGLLWEPIIADGLVGVIEDNAFQYREIASGQIVFCWPLRGA